MKENEYQKPENPMAEGSNRKDIAEPNSQMSAKAQDSTQSSFDDSNSEKAIIDSLFRRVIANATLLAFILQQCLPEFYHYSVRQIVDWMQKVTKSIVELLDPRFSFGGHNLIADTLSRMTTPFVNAQNEKGSEYLINVEMQQNETPGYPLTRRAFWYAVGIMSQFLVGNLYGITPELISIWLLPKPTRTEPFKCIPYALDGSANAGLLNAFFKDKKGWYTETNKTALRLCRNNPVATILFIRFGIPTEDATLLAKVLYQIFLVAGDKRDYEFLESCGIEFTTEEKDTMDNLFEKTNAFYLSGKTDGTIEGKAEGKAEERDILMAEAKEYGPEAVALLQKLINGADSKNPPETH